MTQAFRIIPSAVVRALAVAGLISLSLAGCSEAKRAIGWEKSAPDEFAVVSRAPLALPPDFQLRPPDPGVQRPQEAVPREVARGLLTGSRAIETAGRSRGEMVLLQKTGADRAAGDIRAVINRELAALVEADRSVTDRLVFWRAPDQPGTLLDAEKEALRLRSNQALGASTTEGETPVITRRKKGLLEGLLF